MIPNLNRLRGSRTLFLKAVMYVVTMVCSVATVQAQDAETDVLTIQGTSIRGNQELPTVLYLVPWQAPSPKALTATSADLATRQTLEPLERSEFNRMLRFHDHFLERQKESSFSTP